LKADKKHLESTIKREENILKALLKDKESGSTPIYRVTWRQQVQERIDTAKLRELFPDVAAQVLKETKLRKLDLSKIQESKGEN
jgi:predicted phage-related endonuclease